MEIEYTFCDDNAQRFGAIDTTPEDALRASVDYLDAGDLRALARSLERLTALCDALEVLTDLQSDPNTSSVGWRILNRIASRIRCEIKLESEEM